MDFGSPVKQLVLHSLIDRRAWYAQSAQDMVHLANAINLDMNAELERLLAEQGIQVPEGAANQQRQFAHWCREENIRNIPCQSEVNPQP